jgi:putative tryptophan/tyrosine transport system substrate-binding protein
MQRRDFITLLGGAASAWPLAARGQQAPVPVIGILTSDSPDLRERRMRAFRQGLSQMGYAEGRNVTFEYRFTEGRLELLPSLADDLVKRKVAVILAIPTPAAMAAKAATKTIPIVFVVGVDPVQTGLVTNLARPEGNITGISNLNVTVATKRLELLHELLPAAKSIGYLVNPTNTAFTGAEMRDMKLAAQTLGLRLMILNAKDQSEFDAAFATVAPERPDGIVISGEGLFLGNSLRLVALAAQHAVPTVYPIRVATAAGGLVSYGADPFDAAGEAAIYAGRILKGEKPQDLPVQQSTKVELVINLKSAKALGITFPISLLGRADEVIE